MKFKEFAKWCNDRAFDGKWGMQEAMVCCSCVSDIYSKPFWKKETYWKEYPQRETIIKIVKDTNSLIEKYEMEEKNNGTK